MDIVVISHQHGLLPFAWRLKREGATVHTLVLNNKHERAWDGWLPKVGRGKSRFDHWDEWVEKARAGELIVISDSRRALEAFAGAPYFYGLFESPPWEIKPSLLLGGWFNGEDWNTGSCHWVVPDWGLWPGGLGADALAGATLLSGGSYPSSFFEQITDALKSAGFHGLVSIGLQYEQASRSFMPLGFQAGWPWLHSHLYIGGLDSLSELLAGDHVEAPRKTFTVGVVVSRPPWPLRGAQGMDAVPMEKLEPQVTTNTFFHDIELTPQGIVSPGLDGLVAVTRGSSNSLGVARTKAVLLAQALPLPHPQYRGDVGNRVEAVLAGLEELGYW